MTLHAQNQNILDSDNDCDSQRVQILNHFLTKGRPITWLDGLEFFGTSKLSTRCSELIRQGFPIIKEDVIVTNRNGKKVKVRQYSM